MESGEIKNYTIIALLVFTAYLIWPLLDAVILGVFTAYIFIFVKENLDEILEGRKGVSGLIIIMAILILILGLFYGLVTGILSIILNFENFVDTIIGSVIFIMDLLEFPAAASNYMESIVRDLMVNLRSYLIGGFRDAPKLFISSFVYVATSIYFFFFGEDVRNDLFYSLERLDEKIADILKVFIRSIYDLYNGVFLKRALMSFSVLVISGIGFFLLGIEFWIGWAILLAIVRFIPLLTNFIVYIPLGILYFALGNIWTGLAILIFGLLFIDTLPEIYIKPRIDVPDIKENSFLLFIGMISGSVLLGIKGFIIGPTVLIMFRDMLMHVYRKTS